MSRIGKKSIKLPPKVEVSISQNLLKVKGPKGALEKSLPSQVVVAVEAGEVKVTPAKTTTAVNGAIWGMARTLVANMIHGVAEGFTKDLEFTGVGYRAAVSGSTLTLNLGYSHPIEYKVPKGIEVKVNKNVISVIGSDKELVGLVSADIRSFRSPEPYKGKGIKYVDEKIIRKAGKTAAKK